MIEQTIVALAGALVEIEATVPWRDGVYKRNFIGEIVDTNDSGFTVEERIGWPGRIIVILQYLAVHSITVFGDRGPEKAKIYVYIERDDDYD